MSSNLEREERNKVGFFVIHNLRKTTNSEILEKSRDLDEVCLCGAVEHEN